MPSPSLLLSLLLLVLRLLLLLQCIGSLRPILQKPVSPISLSIYPSIYMYAFSIDLSVALSVRMSVSRNQANPLSSTSTSCLVRQSLLVDFDAFPRKFIELLELCRGRTDVGSLAHRASMLELF